MPKTIYNWLILLLWGCITVGSKDSSFERGRCHLVVKTEASESSAAGTRVK
jgi:hypothetical protein